MKALLPILIALSIFSSCDYLKKNPQQLERLEKDLIDESEVGADAVEDSVESKISS